MRSDLHRCTFLVPVLFTGKRLGFESLEEKGETAVCW